MNKTIEQLKKCEKRAREIALLRDANESHWEYLYEKARQTPEWKAYCESTGISEKYSYGDMIC